MSTRPTSVPCPTCGVGVGAFCKLLGQELGEGAYFHASRLARAERESRNRRSK